MSKPRNVYSLTIHAYYTRKIFHYGGIVEYIKCPLRTIYDNDIYTTAYTIKQARYQFIYKISKAICASPRDIDIFIDDIVYERTLPC